MIERPLDQITLDDIDALVTFQRSESRTLDFKEAFPSGDHKGVRDFLADVTAFANTDGGDIVIGVREDKNGVAAEVAGIGRTGLDQELRRIDDQLRSLVDPSVPSFKVRELPRPDGKSVLVIRVGASLIAPHRVAHDKSSRFYRRANRSNFEMSTTEIRQAFAASRDFPDRIRDLHHKAVSAIRGADMPTRIVAGPTLVVTIAPLSVLREARDIRVTRDYAVLPPDPSGGIHYVVGLEGLIVLVDLDQAQGARSWSVNHRLGYVDLAWAIGSKFQGKDLVFPKKVVDYLPGAVISAIARLRPHGIEGPWIVMATVEGVQGFQMVLGDGYPVGPAWRNSAYLGEVVDDAMGEQAVQPLIESVWRLFGVDQPPKLER